MRLALLPGDGPCSVLGDGRGSRGAGVDGRPRVAVAKRWWWTARVVCGGVGMGGREGSGGTLYQAPGGTIGFMSDWTSIREQTCQAARSVLL